MMKTTSDVSASAQAASPTSVLSMVIALAVVLALAGILLGALGLVRRRIRAEASHAPRDFSLGDLRALHRDGKLTDEEFERAKAKLVSGVRSTLIKEAKPSLLETPIGEELKDG